MAQTAKRVTALFIPACPGEEDAIVDAIPALATLEMAAVRVEPRRFRHEGLPLRLDLVREDWDTPSRGRTFLALPPNHQLPFPLQVPEPD